ncbi:hypothetical protein IWQ62_000161 [Dispira parvispora]|uniref:Tyrosinase copper-binding domain-containing protein n=1 Tax=Dispira parvispora TaxID=1520584 RepID=A0A9W8AV15_9FUNG|nr:hypothetical protein IWQ62_000161 [Dispira parvispora]
MKFTTLLAFTWATIALAAPQDSPSSPASQSNLPSLSTDQKSDGNCSGGIRYRKEFRDCSEDEIQRFIGAVLMLKEQPSVWGFGQNRYEDFALLHGKVHKQVHSVDPFIPFHRMFLLEFENALREVDDGVTVPYWNAAFDYQDPRQSSLWDIMGSSHLEGGKAGCVPDGPFKDWTVNIPGQSNSDCLRRGFDPNAVPDSRFWSEGEVADIVNSGGNFTHFRFYIEYGIHANAHNFGSAPCTLSGDYSPYDPIFYMIHSYVDYLHITWQKSFDKENNIFPDPKAIVPFFNVTVESVLDHSQYCYDYYAPYATGPNGNGGELDLSNNNTTSDNTTSSTTAPSEEVTSDATSTNTTNTYEASTTTTSALETSLSNSTRSGMAIRPVTDLAEDGAELDLLDDQDKSTPTGTTNTTATSSSEPTSAVDSNELLAVIDLPIQPMHAEWAKMNGFDEAKKSQVETTLTTIKSNIQEKIAQNLPIYAVGWTPEGAPVNKVAPKVDNPAVSITKEIKKSTDSVRNSLSDLLSRIMEAVEADEEEIRVQIPIQLSDPNVTVSKDDIYNLIASKVGPQLSVSVTSLYDAIFEAINKNYTEVTVVVKFA